MNTASRIGKKTGAAITQGIRQTKNRISETTEDSSTYQSMKGKAQEFSIFAKDFSEKNSTVSKFIFILFIIIIFGLLIRVGVYIISLFTTPSKNPIIVNGMMTTSSLTKYSVNPSSANSNPIFRSINENQGMEFTWSTWFFISDPMSGNTTPKRIFSKGGPSETEELFSMNAPGLYLYDNEINTSKTNTITIAMSTYEDGVSKITIKNIPIQKWVNVMIRTQNKTIDIYVNGVLAVRKNLNSVIKQNYGDIFVGDSANGMNGFISSLRYFDHAIGNIKIQEIIHHGPNLKAIGNENQETMPPYLATRWYLDNVE